MNKIAKVLLIALMIASMPIKHWAQTPYRQYADDGILMNFHEIDNVDFRVFLLYNLSQDNQFDLIADDEPGLFIINSNSDRNDAGFFEEFESFYQNTYLDFSMLSKMDIYDLAPTWKSSVVPNHFASIMMDIALRRTRVDNDHCALSNPFCTSDEIQFQAATTSQTADQLESGTFDDGCIGSSYNPSWYHMRINDPGQFIIHMEGVDPNNSSTHRDIDFCMWGPFTDPTDPCVSQLTTDKIIDCCYSSYYTEDVYLGYAAGDHVHQTSHGTVNYHLPESGEYYILMITNFSQQPCVITFTKTPGSGPGTTDCGILPGVVTNDGPYCVGQTINLHVNQQAGATYTWSGPNGFTSTSQNPTRPNCTLNMAGTYTCVTTVGGESSTASTEVVIYAMPTADFEATTVCEGEATQFTSTSTTNPPGQEIVTYVWDFGDGLTGNNEPTATHTYAAAGTYEVTLTVKTNSRICMDYITKTVTVEAQPTANFTADTVCQGTPTQFTSTSTGQTINAYAWNFGDGQTGSGQTTEHVFEHPGNHQVTLSVQTEGQCGDEITKTILVYPMPVPTTGSPYYVQYNGSTSMTVNPGAEGNFTYHWEPANMVTNPDSQTTQTVPLLVTQEYTVTVTGVPGGCTVTIPVTVVMDGSDMTATATADQYELCEDESTTLHAHPSAGTGNYTYSWSPAETLNNANSRNPIASPEVGTTTYTCTISDGVVSREVSVTITVYPKELEPIYDYFCSNLTYPFYGQELNSPGTYTHVLATEHGCEHLVELHLEKKDIHSVTLTEAGVSFSNVIGCDSAYWDPEGHSYDALHTHNPSNHWFKVPSSTSSPFKRLYQDQFGCDSLVNLPLTLEYTPDPFEIFPADHDNTSPHWVVTATEFQINTYDFTIWEQSHDLCHWDSIRWEFENPDIEWLLQPDSTTVPEGMNCRVYVLSYIQDTVWLKATVYNKCAPQGVSRRYWLISSFYDIDESASAKTGFTVIPNPNNGQMTLGFEGLTGKVNIKVYDMQGALIDNFETIGETMSYSYQMKDIAGGIYFFVATSKEGTIAKKVVIQH